MRSTRSVAMEPAVVLDYPREGEVILWPQYTLRLTASKTTKAVDVCIDNGPWKRCRSEAGCFWFDWTGYSAGTHKIMARAAFDDGRLEDSAFRRVRVEFE